MDHVERLRASLADAAIFLDFDGTLSEIVLVPSEARPVEDARELLDRLAARARLVAIVSGRGAGELLEWLGSDVEIWGVHGAERTKDGRVELSEMAARFEELMMRVHDEARAALEELDLDGVYLEDKRVMIGFHFRAAADRERAERELDTLVERLARNHGLRRAAGRLAFELRPPIDFTKAAVVLERARAVKAAAAVFVGDDTVDLPGFDALDVLEEEGAITLRVAVRSDESPPELLERADVVVEGPQGVVGFLRDLLA